LQQHPGRLDVAELVAKMRPGADTITSRLLELETSAGRARVQADIDRLREMGVGAKLAPKLAALRVLTQTLDVLSVSERNNLAVGETAKLYFELA
ncbi:MAG: hypothetical protein GWN29_12955, partial [Gammaproteobacteria bacterium]|nr:hypothetical protein [Gammaproteobacteria bacterium]